MYYIVVLAQQTNFPQSTFYSLWSTRAMENGVCGVPSFIVDNGPLVWGQDRLNVVQDMLCGWKQTDHTSTL